MYRSLYPALNREREKERLHQVNIHFFFFRCQKGFFFRVDISQPGCKMSALNRVKLIDRWRSRLLFVFSGDSCVTLFVMGSARATAVIYWCSLARIYFLLLFICLTAHWMRGVFAGMKEKALLESEVKCRPGITPIIRLDDRRHSST